MWKRRLFNPVPLVMFTISHLLCLCRLPGVTGWACDAKPLVLSIQNATEEKGVGVNRGITVKLGTQVLGLRMTFTLNNTRLRNSKDCTGNDTAIIVCNGASGSVYNPGQTFHQELKDQWAVLTIDPPPSTSTLLQGYDTAQFEGGPFIPDFPFEVWSDHDIILGDGKSSPNKSALALGEKSSVLQRFLEQEAVPSKFIGLFFGSRAENNRTNGELVIGGLNYARIAGSFVNWTMDSPQMAISCPLRVSATKFTLNNVQGSHELISQGMKIPACIDPLQNMLTIPQEMYQKWSTLTEHPEGDPTNSPPYTYQTYPVDKEPLIGSVTIELEGGYTVNIPHNEIVSQERGPSTDNLGSYDIVNASRIMTGIGTGITDYGENFGILLGGIFLSQSYLYVDYERRQFGLAPANFREEQGQVQKVCSTNSTVGGQLSGSPSPTFTSLSPSRTANTRSGAVSNSDKIALGVGLGIGLPSVILAAFTAAASFRRRNDRHHQRPRRRRRSQSEFVQVPRKPLR